MASDVVQATSTDLKAFAELEIKLSFFISDFRKRLRGKAIRGWCAIGVSIGVNQPYGQKGKP